MRVQVLPDVLDARVRVLLVGINPGLRSAQLGHHFAGPSNRFWRLLFEAGLVSEPLTFADDHRLPEWGLGLTNLVPRASKGIDELAPADYRSGRRALERKIRRWSPALVGLIGITLARVLAPAGESGAWHRGISPEGGAWPPGSSRVPGTGLQHWRLAGARVFVVPNPSGRNAHYSYARMLAAFRELRAVGDKLVD